MSTRILSDYLPIIIAVLMWMWGTPVYKYLQREGCDPYTMAFCRTLGAAVVLLVWCLRTKREAVMQEFRRSAHYFALAALFIGGLVASTAGTYKTSATFGILMTRATPLLSILFSACIFRDERKLARRPDFILGFAVACAGLVGLSLSKSNGSLAFGIDLGVLLLLACAVQWAIYGLGVKAWMGRSEPFVASMIVFAYSALLALPVMLWLGRPAWLFEAEALPLLVMFASGPLIMGLGEGLFYVSVRRIGLGPSSSFTLLVPLLTALCAWPLLGEVPTSSMAGFGMLLLAGLAVTVRARTQHLKPGASQVEPIAGRQGAAAPTMGEVAADEAGASSVRASLKP